MLRKTDPYITWLPRWIDIILYAIVLAIVAILVTDSYAATATDFFKKPDRASQQLHRPGNRPPTRCAPYVAFGRWAEFDHVETHVTGHCICQAS